MITAMKMMKNWEFIRIKKGDSIMGFSSFMRETFLKKGDEKADSVQYNINTNIRLQIEQFAIIAAINLIAGAVSKCEIKTFIEHNLVKKEEYYRLNIEPNKNQNSTAFWSEVIYKLLYNNECLILLLQDNQLVVSDDFTVKKLLIGYVFEDVTKDEHTFNNNFKMDEVIYLKLNNENITNLIRGFCSNYESLISSAITKYKRLGGRKGVLKIGGVERGKPKFKETLDDMMNNRFKTYFNSDNAVVPLFDGFDYNEISSSGSGASEISDIKILCDEVFDRVGQAFKIPPSLIKGNIADITNLTDYFLTFCIDPLCDLITEELNRKMYGSVEYLKGNHLIIDTTAVKHIDLFYVANNIDKLISSSMYSVNELRLKLGDTSINEEWANNHVITKNYTSVDDLESMRGGENNE